MPFVLIVIGAVLLVAALRNTQGTLATALETDVPGFAAWALAVVGIGALGYVPGLRTISRGLLALVIVVLVLKNYQAMLTGFSNATSGSQAVAAAPTPSQAYAANPQAAIPANDVSGTGSVASGGGTAAAQVAAAAPSLIAQLTGPSVQMFDAASIGFGGIA